MFSSVDKLRTACCGFTMYVVELTDICEMIIYYTYKEYVFHFPFFMKLLFSRNGRLIINEYKHNT